MDVPAQQERLSYLDVMSVVNKIDDDLKKFNKRVIHLHEGVVKYHSKIPKNFSPISHPQGLLPPKAGVKVQDVIDLNDNDPILKKLSQNKVIVITFKRSDLISADQLKGNKNQKEEKKVDKKIEQKEDKKEDKKEVKKEVKKSDKQPTKKSSDLVKWIFEFDSIEIKNKWADIFSKNIQQFSDPNKSLSIKGFLELYNNQDTKTLDQSNKNYDEQQGTTFGIVDDNQNNDWLNGAMKEAKQQKKLFSQLKVDRQQEDELRQKRQEEENEKQRQLLEEEQKKQGIHKDQEEKRKKEEEVQKARKEQERQMRIKIQTAWEFRYYQLMEDCIDSNQNFDEEMKSGVKLVKLLEVFRQEAQIVVKNIVQKLVEAEVHKTQKKDQFARKQSKVYGSEEFESGASRKSVLVTPRSIFTKKAEKENKNDVKIYQEQLKDLTEGKYVFNQNNMLIKIACAENVSKVLWMPTKSQLYKAILNKIDQESLFAFNEQAFLKTIVHSKRRIKTLQEEFKALNYLNDLCMTIRMNDKGFRIKVPLCCIVEHMGFTALVIARPPCSLDDSSLAYGHQDGNYRASGKLDKEMETLGRTLAVKPHHFFWNVADIQPRRRHTMTQEEKRATIFLSFFTEVHIGRFEEFEQLKSMLKLYSDEEIDIFQMRRQGLFYLNKCQDIIPNIMEEEYALLYEVYQQIKVSSDLEEDQISLVDDCVNSYPSYKARPEFIHSYFNTGYAQKGNSKRTYNPDAYETIQESNDIHSDQLELAEMSKFYKRTQIPLLVKKIDDMEINPLDSHTLRQAMQQYGISMRQMGEVAKLTKLPHIRSLFEREMIARTLKNIFLTQLAEEVLSIKDESLSMKNVEIKPSAQLSETEESPINKNIYKQRGSVMLPQMKALYQEKVQVDEHLEQIHREHIVDFLNLVFSASSNLFWEQVIHKQVWSDFNYDIEVAINGICPGGLLHALVYNLKLDIDFEPMQIYTSTPYPSVPQQEVISKYKLKQYLNPKSYQQFFTEAFNPPQQIASNARLSNNQSKTSLHSFKANNFDTVSVNNISMKSHPKRQAIFYIDDIIKINSSVQCFTLRDLQISKLCAKYNDYQNNHNFELAIKTLNIRLCMIEGTTQSHCLPFIKSDIYSDMAALYLKQKDYNSCITKLILAINELQPIFILQQQQEPKVICQKFISQVLKTKIKPKQGVIRPLLILFQSVVDNQEWKDFVLPLFDIVMFIIEFTFGSQHPSYALMFSMMAQFFLNQKLFDDCRQMHQSRIICLLQTVGQSHKATAEAHFDLAKFQDQILVLRDESIIHYEKASLVYESLYGIESYQCTEVAVHLTEVYSACGQSTKALDQAKVALKYYATRLNGNINLILRMKYFKCLNLMRLKSQQSAKIVAEEFLFTLINNWDEVMKQDVSIFNSVALSNIPSQMGDESDLNEPSTKQTDSIFIAEESFETITNLLRVFMELYLQETNKEHRNFLFQVFDQIQENLAREGHLENKITEFQKSQNVLKMILKKIRSIQSLQGFLENMMSNFVESTGADTNRFVFNFKKDPQNKILSHFMGEANFQEAVQDYENLVIALGKSYFTNLFLKIMIN